MAVRIPGINIDEYYQQLGPIEPLIRDDRVTEIMVNGSDHVYVEMGGKVVLTNIKFVDEDQLLNVIQFIVRTVGRRIDERSPLCDARLADGSRVNAVIRPLALNGPLLTNSPRDALARLETLVLMAGVDLPVRAIRQQVAGAINLIVQLSRLRDGSRKVVAITEIVGMEQDVITMQDIFIMEQKGATPDGKVIADFRPTGIRPKILDKMFQQGIPLPKEITTLFPPPPGYKPSA